MLVADRDFDLPLLWSQRFEMERDVVAAILADHGRSIAMAEAEGLTPAHFHEHDLRILFCAADVGRDRDILTVLKIARHTLRVNGFWEDERGAGTKSSRWNDWRLAELVEEWPPGSTAVLMTIRKLLVMIRRLEEIERLYHQVELLVSGEKQPTVMPRFGQIAGRT